jgi:hypothetical protein
MPSQVAAEEDCRDLGIGSAGEVDLNDTRCKRTGIGGIQTSLQR